MNNSVKTFRMTFVVLLVCINFYTLYAFWFDRIEAVEGIENNPYLWTSEMEFPEILPPTNNKLVLMP